MKKSVKRATSVMVAASLLLALSACSGSKTQDSAGPAASGSKPTIAVVAKANPTRSGSL